MKLPNVNLHQLRPSTGISQELVTVPFCTPCPPLPLFSSLVDTIVLKQLQSPRPLLPFLTSTQGSIEGEQIRVFLGFAK